MNSMLIQIVLILMTLVSVSALAEPSRPIPSKSEPPATPVRSPLSTVVSLPWNDDLETGAIGWTTSGFFNVINDPQTINVRNPQINPFMVSLPDEGFLPLAHSGSHALWYGEAATGTFIGADFDTLQSSHSGGTSTVPNTGWAITPEIDMASATEANLSFWTWWEIEGVDVPWFDVMHVEASTDGGINWLPVGSGVLNPLDDVNANDHVGYSSGGVGEPGIWVHHAFLLNEFTGGSCWLRFRFDTVDQLYNGFRGWMIDDISVTGAAPIAPDIAELVPNRGDRDDLIHVHGTNFRSGAQIFIGTEPCVTVVLSENLAQIIVPNMPRATYGVSIVNPDGLSGSCNSCFQVDNVQPPEIQIVTPTWAYVGIPRFVTISGERFNPGAVVTIGGVPVDNLNIIDDQTLTFTTPTTVGLGARPIRIQNTDGLFDLCSGCMEIRPWSFVTSPDSLIIHADPPHIALNWSPSIAGTEYGVFRNDPQSGEFTVLAGVTTNTAFIDSFAVDSPEPMQFYVIRTFAP